MPPKPGSSRRPRVWPSPSATRSRASVPRTQQRVQRDFEEQVDRVNVIVDFDGDGRTGYDFTRELDRRHLRQRRHQRELQFNKDWDGNWQHAVGEDDAGWTVEVLIPWHIAPMREAKGDKRTIEDLSRPRHRLDGRTRRLAAGELRAPALPVRLRAHRSGQLQPVAAGDHALCFRAVRQRRQRAATATPASTCSGNRTARRSSPPPSIRTSARWRATTWWSTSAPPKPSSATSARSSPRTRASSNSPRRRTSASCYTRAASAVPPTTARARATSPRRSSSTAASARPSTACSPPTKPTSVGRTFGALRVVRDFSKQNLGFMATHVDRPYLDRDGHRVRHRSQLAAERALERPHARVRQRHRAGGRRARATSGATVWADYEMDHGWRQQ